MAEWRIQSEKGFWNPSRTPHLFEDFAVCGALGIGIDNTRDPLPEELRCKSCGSDLRCKRCRAIEKKRGK